MVDLPKGSKKLSQYSTQRFSHADQPDNREKTIDHYAIEPRQFESFSNHSTPRSTDETLMNAGSSDASLFRQRNGGENYEFRRPPFPRRTRGMSMDHQYHWGRSSNSRYLERNIASVTPRSLPATSQYISSLQPGLMNDDNPAEYEMHSSRRARVSSAPPPIHPMLATNTATKTCTQKTSHESNLNELPLQSPNSTMLDCARDQDICFANTSPISTHHPVSEAFSKSSLDPLGISNLSSLFSSSLRPKKEHVNENPDGDPSVETSSLNNPTTNAKKSMVPRRAPRAFRSGAKPTRSTERKLEFIGRTADSSRSALAQDPRLVHGREASATTLGPLILRRDVNTPSLLSTSSLSEASLRLDEETIRLLQYMWMKAPTALMDAFTKAGCASRLPSSVKASIFTSPNLLVRAPFDYILICPGPSTWYNSIFQLLSSLNSRQAFPDTGSDICQVVDGLIRSPNGSAYDMQMIAGHITSRFKELGARAAGMIMIVLCSAVLCGRMDIILSLLKAGVDVNQKDTRTGLTPLRLAILARSPPMTNMLIRNGAIASVDYDTMLHQPPFEWVARIESALAHSELSDRHVRVHGNQASETTNSSHSRQNSRGQAKQSLNSKNRDSAQSFQGNDRSSASDDEDSSGSPAGRTSSSDINCGQVLGPFACPYAKFNPDIFADRRGCDTGYKTIDRLKDHLQRKHRAYECERCGVEVADDDLIGHARSGRCIESDQESRDLSKGFTRSQAEILAERWRNKDGEWKWMKIYKVLFNPTDMDDMPSPYFVTRAELLKDNKALREEMRNLRFMSEQKHLQVYNSMQDGTPFCLESVTGRRPLEVQRDQTHSSCDEHNRPANFGIIPCAQHKPRLIEAGYTSQQDFEHMDSDFQILSDSQQLTPKCTLSRDMNLGHDPIYSSSADFGIYDGENEVQMLSADSVSNSWPPDSASLTTSLVSMQDKEDDIMEKLSAAAHPLVSYAKDGMNLDEIMLYDYNKLDFDELYSVQLATHT